MDLTQRTVPRRRPPHHVRNRCKMQRTQHPRRRSSRPSRYVSIPYCLSQSSNRPPTNPSQTRLRSSRNQNVPRRTNSHDPLSSRRSPSLPRSRRRSTQPRQAPRRLIRHDVSRQRNLSCRVCWRTTGNPRLRSRWDFSRRSCERNGITVHGGVVSLLCLPILLCYAPHC